MAPSPRQPEKLLLLTEGELATVASQLRSLQMIV